MNQRCCVSCHREFDDPDIEQDFGGPDPCLGWIPGVMFACCGHGRPALKFADEDGPEELVDTCYVSMAYDWDHPRTVRLYCNKARFWFRSLGLDVPSVPDLPQFDPDEP